MIYLHIFDKSKTIGANGGAETAYPSEEPVFAPGIIWWVWDHVAQFLVFFGDVCESLFVMLFFFLWSLHSLSFWLPISYLQTFLSQRKIK